MILYYLYNEYNIVSKTGKPLAGTVITRIIRNPKYKGYYCGKKTEIIDYMTKKVKYYDKEEWITYKDNLKIPPIISPQLWNLAAHKIEKTNKKFTKNNKTIYKSKYPLSNKIICNNDNSIFYPRKISKTNNDISWWCSNYLNKGKHSCTTPSIREKEIYYILNDIIKYLNINLDNIKQTLINTYIYTLKNNKNIKDEYNKKNNIKLKKNNLLELYTTNNISKDEFIKKNNQYNNQISIINKNINILKKESNNIKTFINNIEHNIQKIQESNHFKEYLINLILNKIIVSTKNDYIILKIYLNNHNNNCFINKYYLIKRTHNKIIKYKIFCYK